MIGKKVRILFFLRRTRKLEVGAGQYELHEWLKTDIRQLDITSFNSWKKNFGLLRLNNVFSEHVWEHLNEKDAIKALENIFYFLKPNGRVRIAVPDGFHPDPEYIEHVRPNGSGPGAKDHKVLYNYRSLSEIMTSVGYKIELKEYWDENRVFNKNEWDIKDGKVARSSQFDKRNKNKPLVYTSLIIDGLKR